MKLEDFFEEQNYNINAYKKMEPFIETWNQWWENDVPSFHDYKVPNGEKNITVNRFRLGMAKTVSEAFADLLLNERAKYNVGKDETESQKFYDTFLKGNDWELVSNKAMELRNALGTVALVHSLKNVEYDPLNDDVDFSNSKPFIEYVTADKIVILSWIGERVIDVAFITEKAEGKNTTLTVSIHKLVDGQYEIHNHFFDKDKNGNLKSKTEDGVASVFKTGSNKPWFVIMKTNIVNNVDKDNPYGVSMYANAIDQLKGVDIAYDSFINEFNLGRKRLFISEDAVKTDAYGEATFDNKDIVFYSLRGSTYSSDDGTSEPKRMIVESNMQLRIDEHEKGINKALSLLSVKVGLGESYFKFENGTLMTATEVISTDSKLYRSIGKQQLAIENSLYDFMEMMVYVGNEFLNIKVVDKISINFDDSIFIDEAEVRKQALTEYTQGLSSPIRYYMETRKLAKEQALELWKEIVAENGLQNDVEEEGGEI